MKNILFLACLSLLVFSSCIKDNNTGCFRVTYNLNAPDAEGNAPVDAGRHNQNDIVLVLRTDAVRPGFTFTGWNTQADGEGVTYLPGETFVIKSNVNLYAQWEESVVFEIVYDANGGTGEHVDGGLLPDAEYLILPPDEAGIFRPDHSFTEWNTTADGLGTPYMPGDLIAVEKNMRLYAQWEENVSVVYDSNGGTGIYTDSDIIPGSAIEVPHPEDINISRSGYSFAGWNTKVDRSGITYFPEALLRVTENVTLYAIWQATVRYYPNGGSNGSSTASFILANIPTGNYTVRAPGNLISQGQPMTREGYVFTEWNTQADGNGIAYQAGEIILLTGNISFYAQWVFAGI